uniref:V-type ATP synthase subunit F n=1 Tax=candidate division WOR-3 bacterium TaxID=2052148 RepID=A0A7C4XF97_UNCW3
MASNIAVVGRKEDILPFLAAGVEVCYIKEGESEKVVTELIKKGMKVIFFSEEFLPELEELMKHYQSETFPCLVPFFSGRARTKLGIERTRRMIKKAAGADIFIEGV